MGVLRGRVAPRFEASRCLHVVQTLRFLESWRWVVFYSILSEFGPRRGRGPRGPVLCGDGARSRDAGRRADAVGGPWDASLVVPRLACLPEGAATHTASTRAASSRCCDASTPPTRPHESPRALRQFRDSVVPTQAKTTRRWRWLLIGEGHWRTRRRRKRPRSREGGRNLLYVAGSLHGSASSRRGGTPDLPKN